MFLNPLFGGVYFFLSSPFIFFINQITLQKKKSSQAKLDLSTKTNQSILYQKEPIQIFLYIEKEQKRSQALLDPEPLQINLFRSGTKRKLNPKLTLSEIDYIINRVGKIRNKLFKREEVY